MKSKMKIALFDLNMDPLIPKKYNRLAKSVEDYIEYLEKQVNKLKKEANDKGIR